MSVVLGVVGCSFIIAFFVLIFIDLNIHTKNTSLKDSDSHYLHNEIEYSISSKEIRFIKKQIIIEVSNIKSVKMEVDQQIVYSSGVTEAIVGGVLFGGTGAVAGSIIGSKPKLSSKAIIFIETDIIQYAGITVVTTTEKEF